MKRMKQLLAMLLALSLMLALAACGGSAAQTGEPAAEPATEANTEPAAEPAAESAAAEGEKLLRVALEGEPANLSFFEAGGSFGAGFVMFSCFSVPWSYSIDGELHMELAESYEYDEEAKELIVKLREDAKFANGDPITAEDVYFSYDARNNVQGNRIPSIDLYSSRILDEHTIAFACDPFNDTVLDGLATLPIGSKNWTENYTNEDHVYIDVLESGAYCVQDGWQPGDSKLILEKNPYYWDADAMIYDRIELSFIAAENTRYLGFTTGDYDVCYLTDSINIDAVQNNADYTLAQYPYQSITALMFDTNYTDSFPNDEIRLAICHAIDVQTIVESLCGSAYIPATSMLPSSSWAYKNTAYTYDPELAKQYYEASGLENFEFTVNLQDVTMDKSVVEAMQAYLAEIGITMHINAMDPPTFFMHLMMGDMDCMLSQYSGTVDPGSVLNQWISASPTVAAHTPTDVQALLDEAVNSSAERSERAELFYDLQDQVAAIGKIVPLYEKTINFAQVNGVDVSSGIRADGYLTASYLK